MLRFSTLKLLNNRSAYLVNLHPKTTANQIQQHPALKNVKKVTFVQEKTVKRMDWKINEKHVVSKNAVLLFNDSKSKTDALLESFLSLGNGDGHYIPITEHDANIKPESLPKLRPHQPRDMVILPDLPEETTEEHIESLNLDGLVDIKLIDHNERALKKGTLNTDKLAYLFFETFKQARDFEKKTHEENIFDDDFMIRGRRVKTKNVNKVATVVGQKINKPISEWKGLKYDSRRVKK